MQLHQLKPIHRRPRRKRVGRGGKRGTYSGRGMKGQKARAGACISPGFRGGNEPLWKLFPKQRGASKKLDIRRALFQVHHPKPAVVNLDTIDRHFQEGDTVSPAALIQKGLVKTTKFGVKILGEGKLTKHLVFSGDLSFSQSARDKIR